MYEGVLTCTWVRPSKTNLDIKASCGSSPEGDDDIMKQMLFEESLSVMCSLCRNRVPYLGSFHDNRKQQITTESRLDYIQRSKSSSLWVRVAYDCLLPVVFTNRNFRRFLHSSKDTCGAFVLNSLGVKRTCSFASYSKNPCNAFRGFLSRPSLTGRKEISSQHRLYL